MSQCIHERDSTGEGCAGGQWAEQGSAIREICVFMKLASREGAWCPWRRICVSVCTAGSSRGGLSVHIRSRQGAGLGAFVRAG